MTQEHMVTPLMIRFALAYHCSGEPQQFFHAQTWESGPAEDAREWLRGTGLLDANDKPTPKLAAYVNHLCAQPLPQARYVCEGIST